MISNGYLRVFFCFHIFLIDIVTGSRHQSVASSLVVALSVAVSGFRDMIWPSAPTHRVLESEEEKVSSSVV